MVVRLRGVAGEIPPFAIHVSNGCPDRVSGQCLVGSLTGAVASQRVTEAREGYLGMGGNHAVSAKA